MQLEMYQSEDMEYYGESPMWNQDEAGEALEDPFVALGRYVKGASKNLWKNIRPKKDGRMKNAPADRGGEQEMEKKTVMLEEEPDSSASGDRDSEDSFKSPADEQPIPLPDGGLKC
jgi:hypothetical protein